MIKSMTGFGLSRYEGKECDIIVEIKSLNSKSMDLSLRLPKILSEKELEIRNIISEKLERGKVAVNIEFVPKNGEVARATVNEDFFVARYTELKKLADRVYAPYDNLFELALASIEVSQGPSDKISDEEWESVSQVIDSAIEHCDAFRRQEGLGLYSKFVEYMGTIESNLEEIERVDPLRVEGVRDRLQSKLEGLAGDQSFDKNRLEQELIYYIEKLDIKEECVRLSSHLKYFLEILDEKRSNGKKLNFISQEIGREINTIGSKANDAKIQKLVVVMKEELEKAKEQLGNIL